MKSFITYIKDKKFEAKIANIYLVDLSINEGNYDLTDIETTEGIPYKKYKVIYGDHAKDRQRRLGGYANFISDLDYVDTVKNASEKIFELIDKNKIAVTDNPQNCKNAIFCIINKYPTTNIKPLTVPCFVSYAGNDLYNITIFTGYLGPNPYMTIKDELFIVINKKGKVETARKFRHNKWFVYPGIFNCFQKWDNSENKLDKRNSKLLIPDYKDEDNIKSQLGF